jgi:pimeloyl-ACP methyl ester carboxylesterase
MTKEFERRISGAKLFIKTIDYSGGAADSPEFVFLHEGLGCVDQWKDFPEKILKKFGGKGVIYDRQGYGRSGSRKYDFDFNYLHTEAIEILPRVIDLVGFKNPYLVGHSDGGSIALIFAGNYSDFAKGVITEAAHVMVEDETVSGVLAAMEDFEQNGLRRALEKYHGEKTESVFENWSQTWTAENFRYWNIDMFLKRIKCPVLAIQGKDDKYGTIEQLHKIESIVKTAETCFLEECGHTPHRDQEEMLISKIEKFISK